MSNIMAALQDAADEFAHTGVALLTHLQQQLSPDSHTFDTSRGSEGSSLSHNRLLRRLNEAKEEFYAHLRWSSPLLQPSTRVPLPTQWDARTILAFVDCLRCIQHCYVSISSSDLAHEACRNSNNSSSSSPLTIPPVTAALVSVLMLVFTRPGGVALMDVALSPFCVVDKKEYWRLLSCHLVHLDAAHLFTNLSALLPDCAALEVHEGSLAAAVDLLLLALAASTAYVGAACLHKSLLAEPGQYYSLITVGASSLGFALKVWAGCRAHPRPALLLGVLPVPSAFSWVPTLALTHLLVPHASFTAHIAGVCAGLCRAYLVQPALQGVCQAWACLTHPAHSTSRRQHQRGTGFEQSHLGQHHPTLAGAQETEAAANSQVQFLPQDSWKQWLREGVSGTQLGWSSADVAASAAGAAHAQDNSSSDRGCSGRCWWRPCAELAAQLVCVGAAVGVYLVCTRRGTQPGRHYISNTGLWLWR